MDVSQFIVIAIGPSISILLSRRAYHEKQQYGLYRFLGFLTLFVLIAINLGNWNKAIYWNRFTYLPIYERCLL